MVKSCDVYGFVDMSPLESAQHTIRKIIAGSPVPEDPMHAENTLQWVLKLKPDADAALQIAALAHDIDRASKNKVQRKNYADYDHFKAAHAENSAKILRQILEEHSLHAAMIKKACHLVFYHEIGGDREADLLKDADSIAYFDFNLPLYFEREGWQETKRRCQWGYQRLSLKMRKMLRTIKHENPEVNRLLQEMLNEFEQQENSLNGMTKYVK